MITDTDDIIKKDAELFDRPLTFQILKKFGWCRVEYYTEDYVWYVHPDYPIADVCFDTSNKIFLFQSRGFSTTVRTYKDILRELK